MTIIVGSLFLPHTVQFEVADSAAYEIEVTQEGSSAQHAQKEAREVRKHSLLSSEKAKSEIKDGLAQDNSASILPSLAQAPEFGSNPHKTNNANNPATSDQTKESAESFFYEKKLNRGLSYDGRGGGQQPSQNNPLVGNLQRSAQSQSPTPQYIQPRARPAGPQPQKSVVDVKKQVDDVGLPSLKINRSSSNLAGMGSSTSSSYTNLAALSNQTNTSAPTARRTINRPSPFTLHGNNSTSSIHEEASNLGSVHLDGKDDWANDFNDISHARSSSKLAPYGGFSKPSLEDGILSHSNIFETAPWSVASYRKGNGSLIKAVDQALRDGKIHKRKWVGTIAMPSDAVPQKVIDDITKTLHDDYDSEAVFPNDDIFQGHYKSFCKQILWPTLHYQIPDDPKSKAFEEHSWEQYKALNQLIADKLVETYKRENAGKDPNDPENIIWIHDYHLLLAPKMVREQLPDAKIGFFLHVSFPSSEVFRCFAQRKSLLEGMLGANCISFQTEEYVRHFLQTCSRLLLADTNELGLTYDKNFVMTSTIPIGIDAEKFGPVTRTEDVTDWRQMIRERWGDQKLIVSRDKLDKLRGIKQKLLAYERFLLSNPEYIDNTVLIQICIGTSHDPDYESELLGIVSRINSLPENISISQPVVFLQQDIDFDQYVALQCEADVFVVSSMREGLNLTCHEFVIATSEKKSPLMISEFAGSSQILDCRGQGALLLNPWSLKAFAETFKQSLTMSKEEKERRWKNMYDMILTHDSNTWIASCLKDINQAWAREEARHNGKMIRFTEEIFQQFYRKNQANRLFFLNLETATVIGGQDPNTVVAAMKSVTNAAAVAGKSASFSEPSTISKLLEGLLSDTSNRVYLVSVLRRSDLDRFYGGIPRLGLVAENGGYIKIVDSKQWLTLTDENEVGAWMPQVRSLIQSKVERLPGSFMEVEDCTVSFRPGKAFMEDRERSIDMMGDCIQHVNDLFQESDGVHAFISKNVVIVQQNLLSLRALEFLVQFHNHTQKGVSPADIIDQFKAKLAISPGTLSPVQSTSSMMQALEAEEVKSLFVIGGTTQIDEPCFEYANSLAGDGYEVQTVTSFGAEANLKSSARYCVGGKNEVLVMLSKVGKEL